MFNWQVGLGIFLSLGNLHFLYTEHVVWW